MTSEASHRSHSTASSNRSSSDRDRSHSRSMSRRHSPESDYERSGSHSSDRSRSRSRSCTRSQYSRSRSRSSRSVTKHSRSWSRSLSRSADRRSYHSLSHSRSRSSSYRNGRRRSCPRSSSRSRSPGSSERSNSRSPGSPHSRIGAKYPRDRSKRVQWNNAIWPVGEKAKDVIFHFCDVCDLPVVIYGRLLPCKHVLCFNCAAKLPNKCNRCSKTIQTIERCLVGGIFMCFESDGCRRTYLSQRDLQAHIDHRHKGGITAQSAKAPTETTPTGSAIPSVVSSTVKLDDSGRSTHQLRTPHVAPQRELLPKPSVTQQIKLPQVSNTSAGSSQSGKPCFPSTGKATGLLPLPTQTTSQPTSLSGGRLPLGVSHPLRLPALGPFSALSQFSTPPPPLGGPRNIPPPAVLNPSIPPPSIPPSGPPPSGPSGPTSSSSSSFGSQQQTQQQAQVFGSASALAALAAAFSAQSKASNLNSRPDNVLSSGNPLQNTGINLSLITSVLRNANAAWNQATTQLPNLTNIAQQANVHTPNQLLNNRPGGLNMRRFHP